MRTVLLETNAINKCVDKGISCSLIKSVFNRKHDSPMVNTHTTYELVRTFLVKENIEKGISLFKFLKELKPIYTCSVDSLLIRELENVLSTTFCTNFVENWFYGPLIEAIDNLSNGIIKDDYLYFINKRESDIKNAMSIWDSLLDKKYRINKSLNFESFFKSIFKSDSAIQIITDIYRGINKPVSRTNAVSLYLKLAQNSCPALKCCINANLYLNFHIRRESQYFSADKTDDFRHLIDSSYCSLLITNDDKLKNIYAKSINPFIEINSFEEYFNL